MDTDFAPEGDTIVDFTSEISKLESPITLGSFSQVYRCTIGASKEVAVKVIIVDHNRAMPKLERAMRRELRLWLKLRNLNIVPLLGIAHVESPWPALVYPWMPSGTLYVYLEKQATTLSASAKFGLVKGVADGLHYLHSNSIVHGDLQPANVLIDNSGNPCLTGFGLATVVGDPELQWNSTTAARDFNSRWRAPEVIGIETDEPARPTFASDIYSFGSVMFFINSGDIPWKEKKHSNHIAIELSRGATPARPENMPNGSWNLIERCWSRDPMDRPETAHIVDYTDQCRINDSQPTVSEKTTLSIPRPPAGSVDLTGQIFGTIGDYVAGGTFGNVYRCEWRQPYGHTVEVAVKALRFHTSEQDLRRFRRELRIWARLVHDNIVALVGTTEGFGPTAALVSLWFPDGNLLHMIAARGAGLNIRSKLQLLHGIASGLDYLHKLCVVHGDITSSNILVDVKDGEYKACLTDFGLSTVLGESSDNTTNEDSKIQHGAIRWTAPELLIPDDHPAELKLTTKHDMYSFGRVMFHVLSLVIPWHDIDDYTIFQKILRREDISRPEISEATSDVTDARWNYIVQCWSVDPSARPSALMVLDFMKSELETLKQDDVPVGEVLEIHQTMPKHDIPSDFTRQISVLKLENPCTSGSFGVVYRHTIETSEGIAEVAVKVFKIDHHVRTVEEHEMAFRRQLKVWIKLSKHQTIVPLLGTANVGSAYPALVSQWMPSGTLYTYLEQGMVTASKKFELARGVADGLMYLHSEGVVHGDLHPGNVLIDGSGNARLTDFGLATVEGNAESQLSMTSGTFNLNPRWRAPEVIGVDPENGPVRPNFKSDIYSFGCIMFFIVSGDMPWKEKKYPAHIIIALSNKVVHARPDNILDDHWNLIQKCWSWNPDDRPEATEVIGCLATEIVPIVGRAKMPESTPRTIPPEKAESTVRPLPNIRQLPVMHLTIAKKKSAVRARNIVIFGAMGAGKSSLINLIADRDIAKTGSNLKRCTLTWTKYVVPKLFEDGMQHNVFDTMGIENPELEPYEYHRSIKNASRLLRELDACGGTSLLVYCVQKGRDSGALRSNYQLFCEVLYQRRVPVVMVVTGLEDEDVMEKWWERYHRSLEASQIIVEGHACVTTLKNEKVKYEVSREAVLRLIRQYAIGTPVSGGWKKEGTISAFMRRFGRPSPEDKKLQNKLQNDLEGRCGMKMELASKAAKTFVYM